MGMGKKPPPKASAEFSRFKDSLRRLVAVPKQETGKDKRELEPEA
jgi:hypothetical protein